MKCNEARQYRDRYLAQELTHADSAAFEAHVNQCGSCWLELIELRNLDLGLDLDDPILQQMVLRDPSPLPTNFTAQVMARVEAERPTGLSVVWPWMKQTWHRRQLASAAYAMSATMVLISAGEVLFLWNQTTDRVTVFAAQTQAYWDAFQAHAAGLGVYLTVIWQWIAHLL